MTLDISTVDFDSLSDADLQPILDLANDLNRESQPRSVDLTPEEFRIFTKSPGSIEERFLATRDGSLVGLGNTRYADDGSNPETLRFQIRVASEHRRRGYGTAMLEHCARTAQSLGRPRLLTMHFDTVPAGAAFTRAVGGVEKLQFHDNVLKMADLDRGLMRRWVDDGPLKAPGYRIELIDGMFPDELLPGIAHLYHVLERDMPMSDGWEPREWTPELIKQMVTHYLEGTDSLLSIAISEDSGDAAGMSQLIRRHSDPSTWIVTTTMVDPAHRGKSLGKWLKGAVNLAALEQWPGAEYQETGNAFTNDAMLAINHAMGFEHEMTTTDVEIEVETALAYVASRP